MSLASRHGRLLVLEALANSYGMIFFSLDRWLALVVFLLSFLDPVAGLSGLLTLAAATGLALSLGLDESRIRAGEFGFNALLVGLGLGAFYQLNAGLLMLLLFAAVITLLLTIGLLGILSKYGLPFLSTPFVLALWVVVLASRNFEALGISERGLYFLNELYSVGDNLLVNIYAFLNELHLPLVIKTYFRSLGAIIFQFNLLSGAILAAALLYHSRIAFTLSVLGFLTAYGFYHLIGADLNQLNYSYIGFNFILSAIAIGGFYLVPSRSAYFWVLLLIPVLAIFTSSLTNLLAPLGLGTYSLPFNLVVIGFLYLLKWRSKPKDPEEVVIQTFSPEKNKYHHESDQLRYAHYRTIAIGLPVMGEWLISQGHDGAYTHQGVWRQAWDLIVTDARGQSYRGNGGRIEDYHCYGKPVVAPADGRIVAVESEVADNAIGEVNLRQNWGNSIVIDHGYSLYSQLSHLQPGSLLVEVGDTVQKGQTIARCGNSGRSPEPHLHFQLQAAPYIGSPTLLYPLSSYLSREGDGPPEYHYFDYPQENSRVSNLYPEEILKEAFAFPPGLQFSWQVEGKPAATWESKIDLYNRTYLQCLDSGALAYFRNDGATFYFTGYLGSKEALLYHFFLAHYKVSLAYQEGLRITDPLPIDYLPRMPWRWLQDLLAPFYQFLKASFSVEYQPTRAQLKVEEVELHSTVTRHSFGRKTPVFRYRSRLAHGQITRFEIQDGRQTVYVEALPLVDQSTAAAAEIPQEA